MPRPIGCRCPYEYGTDRLVCGGAHYTQGGNSLGEGAKQLVDVTKGHAGTNAHHRYFKDFKHISQSYPYLPRHHTRYIQVVTVSHPASTPPSPSPTRPTHGQRCGLGTQPGEVEAGLERQRQTGVVSGGGSRQILSQVGAGRARSPFHRLLDDALAASREVLHRRLGMEGAEVSGKESKGSSKSAVKNGTQELPRTAPANSSTSQTQHPRHT